MIYIPMLKNRTIELRIFKDSVNYFSDKIIPLVEIITNKDKANLDYVQKLINDKTLFIDYFRFSTEKYGKKIDFNGSELAYNISNNYTMYKSCVLGCAGYDNIIPVVSVKAGFEIKKNELLDFLSQLQQVNSHVALRITEDYLDLYEDVITDVLRVDDYLLFDVEEQNPSLKFMELEQLSDLNPQCKLVLLNSPRKASVWNRQYPEHDKTDLIDNCAREIAELNDFEGYGDYCGLKDVMPQSRGGNNTGAAIALLYSFPENVFYSYCTQDTKLGVKGYAALIPVILKDRMYLDPDGDCPVFNRIEQMSGNGGWQTWIQFNAVRYIHQTYKYLK